MRALGVTRDEQALPGDVVVDRQETRWSFTPTDTWRPGTYHLRALDILEDPAGNQIGRAFEVENLDTVDRGPDPESLVIPFNVS